jgi:geranylgeranyl pyrophosphate synthase
VNALLIEEFHMPEALRSDLCEMIRYNALGGKMVRGLFTVYCTYAMSEVWDENIKKQ